MAWYDAQNMGSAFPLLDYGTQTIARNVNNALPNNRNTNRYSGLEYGQQYFPDEEVVDETVTSNYPGANRPLNTLDPNWQHQIRMQEIDRGNIDNKGFNFPSIFGTVKGGLEWLGDKFKRPEAKQRAYESIMGDRKGLGTWETAAGDYGGNRFALTNTPSGLKVGSDIIGYGQGYAKNFDSMFGSGSLEEMEQKKIDWALNRINKGKAVSTRLRNALMQRGLLRGDKPGNVTVDTVDFVDKVGPTVGGDAGPVTTGGGGTFNPVLDPRGRTDRGGGAAPSWGGATAAREAAGQQVAGPGFGRGAYWAKGGRVGLRLGGDPEEPSENIFEFMQDQGINYDQMAEGVKQKFLSDELGAIDVDEETLAMITDLLGRETDVSTISTLTGKDEGTIERVIRVLTTQSQAQGGSVGYFEGGLASLV